MSDVPLTQSYGTSGKDKLRPVVELLPAQNPPPVDIIQDYVPFFTLFRTAKKTLSRKVASARGKEPKMPKCTPPSPKSGENLPLDIVSVYFDVRGASWH